MLSLLGSIKKAILDMFTGMFAFIPQCMYFFYTCMASFLDMLQSMVRKLAGLDSYMVTGSSEPITGDVLERFVKGMLGINTQYSALNTVFWSLVIFGAIVLVLSVIISLIKAHYSYNEESSNPKVPLMKALKSIASMVIVPIVTVFGIGIANLFLGALDKITATGSAPNVAATFQNSESAKNIQDVFVSGKDEWGNTTYASYDIFGMGVKTSYQTFSGLLFKVAVRNANRVRRKSFTASTAGESWSNAGIFSSSIDGDELAQINDVASQIDFAFANNLELKNGQTLSVLKSESAALIPSYRYFTSKIWYLATINFHHFSKYHVGLVWYFYDLWSFNFLLGYIGVILALTFMSSIVFGLIVRLFEATALLLVLPPILGIAPLDDENAFKSWRGEFVGDVLMSYGAVIGLNLIFLILPYIQQLRFFRSDTLTNILNMVIVIVALIAAKQVVEMMSNFVGGKNAVTSGEEAKKASTEATKKALGKAAAGALLVAKFIPGVSNAAKAADKAIKEVKKRIAEAKRALELNKINKKIEKLEKKAAAKEAKGKKLNILDRAKKKQLENQRKQLEKGESEENAKKRIDKQNGKTDDEKEEALNQWRERQDAYKEEDKTELDKEKEEQEAEIEELEAEKEEKQQEISENLAAAEEEDLIVSDMKSFDTSKDGGNFSPLVDAIMGKDVADIGLFYDKSLNTQCDSKVSSMKGAYEKYVTNKQEALGRELTDVEKISIAENAAKAVLNSLKKELPEEIKKHSKNAELHREIATTTQAEISDIDGRVAEIKKRFEKGGDLSDEALAAARAEKASKKWAEEHDDKIQAIIKFGGETLKTVGGVFGLDTFKDKIDKETDALDYGRSILKEFANKLGVQGASQLKPFQTKKERTKAKKAKLQGQSVMNYGKQELVTMSKEAHRLAERLSLYKTKENLYKELEKTKDTKKSK